MKNTNVEGSWKLKSLFWSMETTHESLHLDKWSLVQKSNMGISKSFISIIILYDEVFKCGDGVKFWGCVGTHAEPLCEEFCNVMYAMSYLGKLFNFVHVCPALCPALTTVQPSGSNSYSNVKYWKERRWISSFQNFFFNNTITINLYLYCH
jgi:hypothetical protein